MYDIDLWGTNDVTSRKSEPGLYFFWKKKKNWDSGHIIIIEILECRHRHKAPLGKAEPMG